MRAHWLACLLSCGVACVDVSGGAVEVSWKVFSPSGSECPEEGSRCQAGGVATVVIRAQRLDTPDGGAGSPVLESREFRCEAQTGSTDFNLVDGRYALSLALKPRGPCGAVDCRFTVPPPIVKDVRYSQVTQMGLLEIISENSPRCPR